MQQKRVVFLLGTMSWTARRGDPLSEEDFQLLEDVSNACGVNASIVFATQDTKVAGDSTKVKITALRNERERVLQEIRDIKPDLVMGFGPVALKCLMNRGNVVLDNHLRQDYQVEGIDCPVHFTYSVDHVAAKPGMKKWLVLDLRAAVYGQTTTEWGTYDVILPGTDAWDACPDHLVALLAGVAETSCPITGRPLVGFDLETYPGLEPWHPEARIRMAIISDRAHHATVVQLGPDSRLPDWLRKIVESPDVIKAGSNINFDYGWLRRFGITMQNMHDTSITEHILDETNPIKGLKGLTFIYAPWLGDYSKAHRMLVAQRGGWEHVADDEQYQYAGADGEASLCTAACQLRLIDEENLVRPYWLMKDLNAVLAEMQYNGCRIDLQINADLDVRFQEEIHKLRQKIVQELGPINPGSAPQLAEALTKKIPNIDLSQRKLTRVFQDRPGDDDDEDISTDRATLEREAHKHPIIETVLRWRRLTKLHSTYVVGVRDKYHVVRPDGPYLTTRFRADIPETYRLSSQGPNLQNQPNKPDPDDPHPIPLELNTKRQFVSRFPGGMFMEADLSQAEIRIAAMISDDPGLVGAIRSGEDSHTAMASMMLNKPLAAVTKHERHQCKRLTFLTLYGGGANTLSRQLGIRKEAAKELIAGYFRAFPILAGVIARTHSRAHRDLQVSSMFGFKRRFKRPLTGWNSWPGWRINRQAWNFLIQNGAAAYLYTALIDIHDQMMKRNMRSKLVLTVHDSVGIDCHPEEVYEVAALVRHCMENANTGHYGCTMTIPMVCDIEVGTTWGDKQPLQPEEKTNGC